MINYMVLGGLFTIFPISVTKMFGLQHGPQIYVQIMGGGFVSAILNLISTKYILPVTSFITIFYIGSLTQVITLVLLWCFEEELDYYNLEKANGLEPIPHTLKESKNNQSQ